MKGSAGAASRVLGRHAGDLFHIEETVGGPARLTVIVLLASVLGLQAADIGAIGALAAPLEKSFHIGNASIGLLVTVTTLVGCVATLPFGSLSDHHSRTRQLQIVVALWAVATIASALAVSYPMLLAARLALGGVIAAAGPAIASLVGDLFPGDERGRLYGFVLTGELIGAGIGILVAGGISGFASWRLAIGALAAPALVLAWALRRYLPEPARGGQAHLDVGARHILTEEEAAAADLHLRAGGDGADDDSTVAQLAEESGIEPEPGTVLAAGADLTMWQATRFLLRLRTNVALIVASGFGYFFLGGLETFAELYFRERYGVSQTLASVLFILVAAGAVVGVLVSGRVADHLVRKGRPDARMAVAAVAYAATAVTFLPGALAPLLVAALPILLVAAACVGATNPPANAARLDIMPARLWGRAEAVRTVLQQLLQGLAPLLFGLVSEAFGGGRAGLGDGVNVSAQRVPVSGGHGLEISFLIMTSPLLVAGAALWMSRSDYLRDVVSAHRSDEAQAGA